MGLLEVIRSARTPLQDTAKLNGTVLDAISGQPIGNAEVRLVIGLSAFPEVGLPEAFAVGFKPPIAYSASTDSSGRFSISGIRLGPYRIGVSNTGYVNYEVGQQSPGLFGTSVEVRANSNASLVIRLTPAATISGQITSDARSPLSNFPVYLLKPKFDINGNRKLISLKTTQTSQGGAYTFTDVAPGRYYVASGRGVSLGPGALKASQQLFRWTFYPGSSEASQAGQIDVSAGTYFGRIDLEVPALKPRTIKGTVIDSRTGKPPEKSRGYLQVSLPFENTATFSGGVVPIDSASGKFEVGGLIDGVYAIGVDLGGPTLPGQASESRARDAWYRLSISDSEQDIQIRVPRSGSVSGKVSIVGFQGSLSVLSQKSPDVRIPGGPSDQAPRISFVPIGIDLQPPHGVVPIDLANGRFEVPNALSGRYKINVVNIPTDYYLQRVSLNGAPLPNAIADFRPEDRIELSISLSRGSGEVRGVVVNSDRKPFPGVSGFLLPDPLPEEIGYYQIFSTDEDGTFSIMRVPPARYRIYPFKELALNEIPEQRELRAATVAATAITVMEGSRISVTAPVIGKERLG